MQRKIKYLCTNSDTKNLNIITVTFKYLLNFCYTKKILNLIINDKLI